MIQPPTATQCPMCFLPYDERDHLPFDICKESHSMCSSCLAKIKNSNHNNCFICKNPLEERSNKLAQQLLRMIWSLTTVAQQKPPTEVTRQNIRNDTSVVNKEAFNRQQRSPVRDTDSMARTAFFPNPSQFVETTYQLPIQNQFPSAKVLGNSSPLLPPPPPQQLNQSQPSQQQLQQHYKAITDKIQSIQAQQNQVNVKYQQLTYKNQQQSATTASQDLVNLQKQHTAYQQQLDKLKKYQQDLYNQMRVQQQPVQNINPMHYNGVIDPQLAASFGNPNGPNQKPTSSLQSQQSPSTQKQSFRKPQSSQQSQQPVNPNSNGKMLPTANDSKIPNLPSQK